MSVYSIIQKFQRCIFCPFIALFSIYVGIVWAIYTFFIHQSCKRKQQTKFLDLRFQNNNGFEENIKSFHLKVAGHKLDYDCKKRHGAQVIWYSILFSICWSQTWAFWFITMLSSSFNEHFVNIWNQIPMTNFDWQSFLVTSDATDDHWHFHFKVKTESY